MTGEFVLYVQITFGIKSFIPYYVYPFLEGFYLKIYKIYKLQNLPVFKKNETCNKNGLRKALP